MLNIKRFSRIFVPMLKKAPLFGYAGLSHKPLVFFSQKKESESIKQAKQQGKQFYSNHIEDIIELTRIEDWQQIVGTCTETLILDFYADWCTPCKKLTPRLEKRVKQSAGKLKLLKINIDKFGQIAQVFQIKSVPTVYMVYGGKAIDAFSGEITDQQLTKFLQTAGRVADPNREQADMVKRLDEARQLIKDKKYLQAQKTLTALKYDKVSQQYKLVGDIFLALVYSEQGKMVQLKTVVEIMKLNAIFYMQKPEFQGIFSQLCQKCELFEKEKKENSEVGDWKAKLEANPENCGLKYEAAQFYRKNLMIQECLSALLDIVRVDKNWSDKKANKEMIDIFKQLGNTSPITQKYRKLLQRLLY